MDVSSVTAAPSNRARILKMKMYLSMSQPKLRTFLTWGVPLAADFSHELRSNTLDLITRHGRVLQTKRVPIDLWITLLPFVDAAGIRKLACTSAMTLFLLMENSAVKSGRAPVKSCGMRREDLLDLDAKGTTPPPPMAPDGTTNTLAAHPHPLVVTPLEARGYLGPGFMCDLCHRNFRGASYHCKECQFDACAKCGE